MTTLAIIPARKGSKRLPGKNMMDLCGHPLIYYSLIQARFSTLVDNMIVSTDSKEIREWCKKNEANCIDRPAELATDYASSEDVVKHTVRNCGFNPTLVVLLQPTSPLRAIDDINNCILLSKYGNVVSVVEFCDYGFKKNGAVYVWHTHKLFDGDIGFQINYVMPRERSIDIDTQEDFDAAERIMNDKHRV